AAPRCARTKRAGPLAQGRARAYLPAGAPAPAGGGALDEQAARALGAPPRSTRQLFAGAEGELEVNAIPQRDPHLDLLLERVVDVPPELVWAAWTVPEHVKKWFTPAPWKTVDCEIDLRPGGIFRTVMRSPGGQALTNIGCFLEMARSRRLGWTVALGPGFRPSNPTFDVPLFTAIITLEPHGKGTKYSALAIHKDEASRDAHDRTGFSE